MVDDTGRGFTGESRRARGPATHQEVSTIAHATRGRVVRARRRRSRGQGLVEFALTGGVFFAIVFGSVDAGLLMYLTNAASHSAQIGMITLADEGTYDTGTFDSVKHTYKNADSDAITQLEASGVSVSSVGHLDEIDIYQITICDQQSPNPQPAGCSGQADGYILASASNSSTYNAYNPDGTCKSNCVSCASGCDTCTTNCVQWLPGARSDKLSTLTAMGITIKYHFNYLGLNQPSSNLTQTRYFRLEPRNP